MLNTHCGHQAYTSTNDLALCWQRTSWRHRLVFLNRPFSFLCCMERGGREYLIILLCFICIHSWSVPLVSTAGHYWCTWHWEMLFWDIWAALRPMLSTELLSSFISFSRPFPFIFSQICQAWQASNLSQRKGRAPGPFHKAILLLPSWEGSELGLLYADGFVESCEIIYKKKVSAQ